MTTFHKWNNGLVWCQLNPHLLQSALSHSDIVPKVKVTGVRWQVCLCCSKCLIIPWLYDQEITTMNNWTGEGMRFVLLKLYGVWIRRARIAYIVKCITWFRSRAQTDARFSVQEWLEFPRYPVTENCFLHSNSALQDYESLTHFKALLHLEKPNTLTELVRAVSCGNPILRLSDIGDCRKIWPLSIFRGPSSTAAL